MRELEECRGNESQTAPQKCTGVIAVKFGIQIAFTWRGRLKKTTNNGGNAPVIDVFGPRCYGTQIRMTSRVITRLYSKALAKHEIESTEFSLLCAFSKEEQVTLSRLAEMLDLERSTLVRNAKNLAKKGFIVAEPRSGGGINYIVTAAGRVKIDAAFPEWRKVQNEIGAQLAAFGASDFVKTLHHLRKIGKP